VGDLGNPFLILSFNSWTQDANSTIVDLRGGGKEKKLWKIENKIQI
jgi:hypothetical protein